MTENLNVSRYNNSNSGNVYSALYNRFAAKTGQVCPAGWHIPTIDEWTSLFEYISGPDARISTSTIEYFLDGGYLKETGTEHWDYPNGGAYDVFGFKSLLLLTLIYYICSPKSHFLN